MHQCGYGNAGPHRSAAVQQCITTVMYCKDGLRHGARLRKEKPVLRQWWSRHHPFCFRCCICLILTSHRHSWHGRHRSWQRSPCADVEAEIVTADQDIARGSRGTGSSREAAAEKQQQQRVIYRRNAPTPIACHRPVHTDLSGHQL